MKEPKVVKPTAEELAKIDSRKLAEEIGWKCPDPNDPDLEPDQILCYLTLGSRKPQNKMEQEWYDEAQRMKNDPNVKEIEIPFN